MTYSSKIYAAAASELQRRRDRGERELASRRSEAFARQPALASIEQEIASAGLEVVKAIGMGEKAQPFIEQLAKTNLAAQNEQKRLLKAAGFSENYLDIRHVCSKCRDTGFVSGKICECHTQLLRALAFSRLSELSPAESSTFESFSLEYYPRAESEETGTSPREHMAKIFSYCKTYAENFDKQAPSLLFHGETGLGKTHLSLAIAGRAVSKGYGVVYGSAQNLINKLEKEHFSYRSEEKGETEEILNNCDLLILDDLGAEFSTQFTVAAIYNIINTRILHRLPTIISTNLEIEELEAKYARRITSRITGHYIPLLFFGRDIRQLKSKY